MTKQFIEAQKQKLKEKREQLEKELSSFAKESKKAKGDWDAKIPSYDGGSLEEQADEVEEYTTLLALERTLEQELKKVNSALEKLKKGKYGICEKCGRPILQGRLKVYPQAEYCRKCQ